MDDHRAFSLLHLVQQKVASDLMAEFKVMMVKHLLLSCHLSPHQCVNTKKLLDEFLLFEEAMAQQLHCLQLVFLMMQALVHLVPLFRIIQCLVMKELQVHLNCLEVDQSQSAAMGELLELRRGHFHLC